MENCPGKPGVAYNFNNQNLINYQDNFHAKGDVPFVIYFDFETTAPTNACLDPEQKKIIEKQRIIDPCERSIFQLVEQFIRGEMIRKLTYRQPRLMQIFFKKRFCKCI